MNTRMALKALLPREALQVCAFFILLNAPLALATKELGLARPLINYDYMVPVLLAAFSAVGGSLVFAVVFAADLVTSLSFSYHFENAAHFAGSFGATPALFRIVSTEPQLLMLAVPLFIWPLLLYKRWRRRDQAPSALCWAPAILVFLTILLAADTRLGTSMLNRDDSPRHGTNLSGSPLASHVKKLLTAPPTSAPVSTEDTIFATDRQRLADNSRAVLLILVESMGLPQSPQAVDWLSAFFQVLPNTTVTRRTVGFKGSTVAAELRHLCGVIASRPGDVTQYKCLPASAGGNFAHTFAAHGNTSLTFDRKTWWPPLGFKNSYFREDIAARGAVICEFAYRAVCDQSLVEFLFSEVQPRGFGYGLTVSTHLPLPQLSTDSPGDFCESIQMPAEPCRLIWQQGQVLEAIADQIRRARFPLVVYIVGDHAPPFVVPRNRNAFSSTQTLGWKIETYASAAK
jgi:hypothetical protein